MAVIGPSSFGPEGAAVSTVHGFSGRSIKLSFAARFTVGHDPLTVLSPGGDARRQI